MFRRIDWFEIFTGAILFICGVLFVLVLVILAGDVYYRATSETVCTEMELAISAKDKETTSSVKMVGKIPMTQTDTDYFIYCDGIEIEVDYSNYNSLSIGDSIIIVKKDWVREGEVWDTDYYLKGE